MQSCTLKVPHYDAGDRWNILPPPLSEFKIFTPALLILGGAAASWYIYETYSKSIIGPAAELPIGLPNPRNLCYFNALLQAMAANGYLIHFLEQSARLHHDRLLSRLVCLLEGLRCSSRYIDVHQLSDLLETNHTELLNEILNTQKWSMFEQQDAHELFGFLMDQAYSQNAIHHAKTPILTLSRVFDFTLTPYERISISPLHCSTMECIRMAPLLCSRLPTLPFHQNLIASQVSCTKCDYRGHVNIQPEACLTIFLRPRELIANNRINPKQTKFNQSANPFISPSSARIPAQSNRLPSLNDYLANQSASIEPLPDLPCPKCQALANPSKSSSCQRQQWIAHVPNYLVLYVQRSDWLNLNSGSNSTWSTKSVTVPNQVVTQIGTKRSEHMSFPSQLDMSNYLLSSKVTKSSLTKQFPEIGDHCQNTCPPHPQTRDPNSKPQQSKPYILRSVLVHQGQYLQSGHYITYRTWPQNQYPRNEIATSLPSRLISTMCTYIVNFFKGLPTRSSSSRSTSSKWLLASDSHILRVSDEEVHSSMAYLLFYERVPDPDPFAANVSDPNMGSSTIQPNTSTSFPISDHQYLLQIGDRTKADSIRSWRLLPTVSQNLFEKEKK